MDHLQAAMDGDMLERISSCFVVPVGCVSQIEHDEGWEDDQC